MAADYSKWSTADLEALANDDYSKLSELALKELSSESIPVAQGGEPGFGNKAAEMGGQALGAVQTAVAPVTNFIGEQIAQHPLASGGLASSYVAPLAQKVLPESIYNKVPGMTYLEKLAETRRNLTGQVLGKTAPTGPVGAPTTTYPESAGVKIPINQPIAPGTAVTPGPAMTPSAPAIGGPAAAEGSTFIQRLAQQYGNMARQVAPVLQKAAPYMEGASKMLAPAMIAKELFYTSPEEIAILRRAEEEKRAKGWRPINER